MEIGSRLGPYEIVSRIGAGGMGEVWKARDTRLERSVAIKILPAEFARDAHLRARFEREAKTISQLEHPYICRLYDVGEPAAGEAGSAYLVMELLEGESLADRLARGPMPIADVLRYGAQIAEALDRAHRAGIVHRDLKPGNIMITRSGAKLLDFGLARNAGLVISAESATVHKPLTQEGTILGTFQYMAPEQIEGAEADARSDLFALGAVLYEMATGRRAFEGKTKTSLIAAIVDRDPAPISAIQPLTPPLFERVVSTCLAKDPDERWQSAHDLRRELEWIRDGVHAPEARGGRSRRMPATTLAALLLLPLLSAAAVWIWTRATTQPPRRVVSSIVPPSGSSFVVTGDVAGPPQLSPDGRMAAFVASTGGVAELWVQSLETGVTRRLPGTSRGMFPFWSPDNRALGFFADGKLLVMDLDATAPQQISDAPDGRGGMWTADGRIVFAPTTQGGLRSIPAAGGTTTPLTEPKPPHTTHRWPALLPDGRHFVFLAASHGNPGGPDTAIMMAAMDGKDTRKVIASGGNGIPYRDYLLHLRGERLVAQKLENGALTGPAIQLWDQTLYDPGTWRAIFSVSSNGLLATYRSARLNALRLVSIDRNGVETGQIGPPGIYRDVSLSPDGEKVAYTLGDPNSILYVQDLRRGLRSRLSFLNAVGYPVWTPDGKHVVFNHVKDDGRFQIVMKPVDGSATERTLAEDTHTMQPTSVDEKRGLVLYTSLSPDATDVMAIPLAGGKPITVAGGPGQQTNGMVSPDGRWLAYVEVTAAGRAAFVTTYPVPGPKWQVSEETAYWLWWSGSGRELRFLTGAGQLKAVSLTFEGNAIQFSAPHSPIRINVNTNRRGLSVSRDGERIVAAAVADVDPGAAILVSNFDAGLR